MPLATLLFFSFICSLSISMALIPLLMTHAHRLHVVDMPGGRKQHGQPVARVGGLAIAFGTSVAILLWLPHTALMIGTLLGGLAIFGFGLWDDRSNLHYGVKFGGQLLAAIIVMFIGGVQLHTLPGIEDLSFTSWIALPLTAVFIVAVTNAVNLSDGLDGLAGGLSLLSFGAMAYLAYVADLTHVTVMIVAMSGAVLGFLRFNTYPARIFMGDGGSQFLGFNLAVAAIVVTDPEHGPYGPSLIPLLLGLPILDTVGVMAQRILDGRSPFVADRNHLHHKLLSLGWLHYETVVLIYVSQGMMVGLACLLRWEGEAVALAAYAVFAGLVLSLFLLAKPGGSWRPVLDQLQKLMKVVLPTADSPAWLAPLPLYLLRILVPFLIVAGVLSPFPVPKDMAVLSGVLGLAIGAAWLLQLRHAPIVLRLGLYVGTAFLLYLYEAHVRQHAWPVQTLVNGYFLLMGLLVILAIRFDDAHRFRATPLDYLIVLFTLMASLMPELNWEGVSVGSLTAKFMIMLFVFELLLHVPDSRYRQLSLMCLWLLFGLAARVIL